MPKQLAESQTKLETVGKQLETAKIEVTKPFAQETELAMEDELEGEREVADCPAKNISMAQKAGYTGVDKEIRKYEDAFAERVSLKAKLEVMKERVVKGEYQKPEIKKEKDVVI